MAIIPLAPALLSGSSDLPESYPREGVGGAGAPPLLFGLAPCGVYPAPDITIGAVRSYPAERGCRSHPHLFTLTSPLSPNSAETREPAVCFLWHFPYRRRTVRLRTSPCDPRLQRAHCPAEFGLSSPPPLAPVILFGSSRHQGEAAIARPARASFIIRPEVFCFKGGTALHPKMGRMR